MNAQSKIAANMIAAFFFGKTKTQNELREAIKALSETTLFPNMTAADIEQIARHNEATQGITIFGSFDY